MLFPLSYFLTLWDLILNTVLSSHPYFLQQAGENAGGGEAGGICLTFQLGYLVGNQEAPQRSLHYIVPPHIITRSGWL